MCRAIPHALDGRRQALPWMPAHCTPQQVGEKVLSDGSFMTESDRRGNAFVDRLAKQAATWDRIPRAKILFITQQSARVIAIATWIGQVGVIAKHFRKPGCPPDGKQVFIRDSEGGQSYIKKLRKPGKRKRDDNDIPCSRPGDLSLCPRWAALRQCILDKSGVSD